MTCERIQRLMGVPRELGRAEQRMLSEHLRTCRHCQAAWSDEKRVLRYLEHVPQLNPPVALERRLLTIPLVAAPASRNFARYFGNHTLMAVLVGLGLLAAWPTYHQLLDRSPAGPDPVSSQAFETGRAAIGSPAGGPSVQPILRMGAVNLLVSAPAADSSALDADAMVTSLNGRQVQRSRVVGARNASSAHPPAGSAHGRPLPADGSPNHPDNPNPPAADDGNGKSKPDGNDRDSGDRDTNPGASRPVPTPVRTACYNIHVQLFADLAGGNADQACGGCDGQWGEEDAKAAAARGIGLPAGIQLVVSEGTFDLQEVIHKDAIDTPDYYTTLTACTTGAANDLRVSLHGLDEDLWSLCPTSAGPQEPVPVGDGSGDYSVRFALVAACPPQTPPPPISTSPAPLATDPAPSSGPPASPGGADPPGQPPTAPVITVPLP